LTFYGAYIIVLVFLLLLALKDYSSDGHRSRHKQPTNNPT